MNPKVILLVAFWLAWSSPNLFAQQPLEVLTLDQAISIALRDNRTTQNARFEVEKSQERLAATRTQLLPSFKLSTLVSKPLNTFDTTFDKGVFGTLPTVGPIPSEDTVITSDTKPTALIVGQISQPLSQLHRIKLQIRQQEAAGQITHAQLSARQTLRANADRVKSIFEETGIAERVRDDWGEESFAVRLKTDPDRANIAGLTNLDVAMASSSATTGHRVTTLREGDKQIPVIARLRMEERAQLGDIKNLYVYSGTGTQKVHLSQVSSPEQSMQTEKMRSRNQFRTITVKAIPIEGRLASEVMNAARPKLEEFARELPAGYRLEIGGEEEDTVKGFRNLTIVLLISVVCIFLALVFQFKNAIKPFIVFAAVPFGMVGALAALWIMGAPFGFMAFLGVVSLVGVIVSHIIVLFDFIEEKHAEGEPLIEALLDAGIMRLRPVMITVGATVIALFPLASHGGPLWEPMCYAQIGGLSVATFVTLLLVPVLCAIFVLDLKLVKWEKTEETGMLDMSVPPAVAGGSTVQTQNQ